MKAARLCEKCLANLGEKMAIAGAGGNQTLKQQAQSSALGVLAVEFAEDTSIPTRIATQMFRQVVKITQNSDPFAKIKAEENERAKAFAQKLRPDFADNLYGLIMLSVTGNRIDFFRAMDEVEAEWRDKTPRLAIDHRQKLIDLIIPQKNVLVLADNVGEFHFDKPLLDRMASLGANVTYAVKGRPSQNDLTISDVQRFGLEAPGFAHNGTDWVGTDLAELDPEFVALFNDADVIVSKGMANMETLTEYGDSLKGRNLFFLLVAKCQPVADYFGVGVGDMLVAEADDYLTAKLRR